VREDIDLRAQMASDFDRVLRGLLEIRFVKKDVYTQVRLNDAIDYLRANEKLLKGEEENA
jgi:hypothetical protein